MESRSLEWTPEGAWLFATELVERRNSIVLVSAVTGKKHLLTSIAPTWSDNAYPSISPDGKTLAFIRFLGDGFSRLAELRLDRNYNVVGAPILLGWPGFSSTVVRDPTWASNSQDLLFTANPDGVRRIWRSRNEKQPELIGDLGAGVGDPATSRSGHGLQIGV